MPDKDKEIRDRIVTLRMNEAEFEKLEANRKKTTEQSNSSYLRKLALNKPVTVRTYNQSVDELRMELAAMRKELNAIGQNLNQAVRKLHTLKMIPEFRSWIQSCEHTRAEIENRTSQVFTTIQKASEKWWQE